mgnify:FL=1
MSNKTYDYLIFGASGFTGRLVAEYFQNEYGKNLNWAVAGRNQSKLEEVLTEIGANAPIEILDSSDAASIHAAISKTKVLITTVGPYQLYGSDIVKKCAELGVHYVDLSGEPGWMHYMQEHQSVAKESGARIVHSCGFDSIPSDLGVFFLQQKAIEKYGKPFLTVKCGVRSMVGEFSGGTAASLNATLQSIRKDPNMINILMNPFSLAEGFEGPTQPDGNTVIYDEDFNQWMAPFIMAPINTKNVHRSNKLLSHLYGKDLIYSEMMMAGDGDKGKETADFIASVNPLMGENVPKPGEGPSKESREAGSYDLVFLGVDEINKMQVAVKGNLDPGYGSTSKMIAESGICLLEDCADLPGGIYTTAPAMGNKLISRLEAHDVMHFTEEEI